jgi:hypothetical protein
MFFQIHRERCNALSKLTILLDRPWSVNSCMRCIRKNKLTMHGAQIYRTVGGNGLSRTS